MKTIQLSLLFVFGLSLFFFTACEDDDNLGENGDVSITFNAVYDDAALDLQQTAYDYPDGAKIKVQLFQYYISDLVLVRADGGTETLSEIELIRYNAAGAGNTQTLTFDNVPAGDYVGLRYGIGVKPELNNQPPSNFAADYVLNEVEYWNDNVRYVFAKIEGNVDLNDDGTFDTPVSYHMGSNDIYSTLEFSGNFSISENGTTNFDIVADVFDSLASSDTDFQDFSDESQRVVHGGNQQVAADIWTRFTNQFRLTVR